jgi:hypothetical protein
MQSSWQQEKLKLLRTQLNETIELWGQVERDAMVAPGPLERRKLKNDSQRLQTEMADLENQIRDLERQIATPSSPKNNSDPAPSSPVTSQPTSGPNYTFNAPVTGQMQNLGGTISGGTFNFGTQATPPPSTPTAKTTILFLSPYPSAAKLNITQEIQAISAQLAIRDNKNDFHFEPKDHIKNAREIESALTKYRPQIVHFSCHANSSGFLLFYDNSERQLVSATQIEEALEPVLDYVRCVVFNACFSQTLVEPIQKIVDCVVASKEELGNLYAVDFSNRFYEMLFEGFSILKAFQAAQKRLPTEQRTNVNLFVKPGADAAQIKFA